MKKENFYIIAVLGYAWLVGLDLCNASECKHFIEADSVAGEQDVTPFVPANTIEDVSTKTKTGDGRPLSGNTSITVPHDIKKHKTTEKEDSDRIAPIPPPTNLRVVIIRD